MNWQPSTENYFECVVDGCTFQIIKVPNSQAWQIFMHFPTGVSAAKAYAWADVDRRCAEMLAEKRHRDEQAYAELM